MPEEKKVQFWVGGQLVGGKPEAAPAPAADVEEIERLLQANEDLKADLDKAKVAHDELSRKTAVRAETLQADLDKARDQVELLSKKAADLDALHRQDTDQLRAELAHAQEEGGNAQAQVSTLTAELEELRQRPFLPADARKRLIALPKIGEALADSVLNALKPEGE